MRHTGTVDDTELQAFVDGARAASGVPGIAVGVLSGESRLVATSGVSNAELGHPVRSSTLFQAGSISKTFTSALVMMLVAQGKLALEDPVAKHLPDLAADAPELCLEDTTIEQLLSHTAGFDGDHLLVQAEGHDLAALGNARRLFAPGTGWSYSNAGFSMAGAVVEQLTGEPFHRVMQRRLLKPLGMAGAAYRADDVVTFDVAAPHWVHGDSPYVIRGAGWQPGWELEPLDHAPGGLVASVEHLLTWCRVHLDGHGPSGEQILTADQLDRLHTPVVAANGGVRIGLDWFVKDIEGATTIGHGGTTAGYISDLVIVPEADAAVVILTNATNGGAPARVIRRWALNRFADITETDPEPDPNAAPSPRQVIGRYLHAFGVLTVRPGDHEGELVITTKARDDVAWQPPADPPVVCGFVDQDTIVGLADGPKPLGTFCWGTDGRAAWLNWHERCAPRID